MELNIKKQLKKHQPRIVEELQAGKDIQISYQKSKNRLHLKAVEVKKIV